MTECFHTDNFFRIYVIEQKKKDPTTRIYLLNMIGDLGFSFSFYFISQLHIKKDLVITTRDYYGTLYTIANLNNLNLINFTFFLKEIPSKSPINNTLNTGGKYLG